MTRPTVPDDDESPDPAELDTDPGPDPDIVYGIGDVGVDRYPLPLHPGRPGLFNAFLGSNLAFTGGAPSEPATSTPLAVGESPDSVPTGPLWAMKYLRHGQHSALTGQNAPEALRLAIGSEKETIYAIDDGASHAMVARQVGSAPDGCLYCLVARVRIEAVLGVREGLAPLADVFAGGKEITLCGVVEGSVSNVVRVASYRKYRDVPAEYLPPSPFVEFPDTL
ncbi:MAG TPA: hypothetical protein VHU85_11730 [Acidimicrobiales bacterium]|jgi:hypothetical protein|nr:hypothetical protein [Acidimicrobiales bacterium]